MPLTIALDYDGTVTADPELWKTFLKQAKSRRHRVAIVTMRYPEEPILDTIAAMAWRVIYTSRRAKENFLSSRGIHIDIWIDDNPGYIFSDAESADPAAVGI